MMNKLTRENCPIFDDIIDDNWDISHNEFRRGSTFFRRTIHYVMEKYFPEYPDLWGFWETNTYVWSEEDYDRKDITELNRVEEIEETIVVKTWAKDE